MTSKEKLEALNYTWFYEPTCQEDADKREAIIKELETDLEILEIIKKWSFLDTFYKEDTDTTYDRFLCSIHTRGMREDFEKIMRWFKDGK